MSEFNYQKSLYLGILGAVGFGLSCMVGASHSLAADKIQFESGPPVSIFTLVTWASGIDLDEIGGSGPAKYQIRKLGLTEAEAKAQLTQEISYSAIAANKLLNTVADIGSLLNSLDASVLPLHYDVGVLSLLDSESGPDDESLFQFSPYLNGLRPTPTLAAFRSAILFSLLDDGKMTPLEVLKNYPTDVLIQRQSGTQDFTGLGKLQAFFTSSNAQQISQDIENQFK